MKLTKSQLKEIIREEIKRIYQPNSIVNENRGESWYIYKSPNVGKNVTIKTYDKFDRNQMVKDFDNAVQSLKDGDDLYFKKDTDRQVDIHLFSVEKKDGKVYTHVFKGGRLMLKPYKKSDL
jgi:hypothetical protein